MTELIQLEVADGTEMAAFAAFPAESHSPAPGVLVLQEAYGVNSHIRDVATRLTNQGYVALAPELFHRTAPGFQGSYTDFEAARVHLNALTEQGLELDLRAAFAALTSMPRVQKDRIGAIGFCMGGRAAYFANSILPLRAAISFYGGRIAPALLSRAPDQHGPILLFWGGMDANIGVLQQRQVEDALREAKKPFGTIEYSWAGHGFFCDQRASFDRAAADQAWGSSLAFLKANL